MAVTQHRRVNYTYCNYSVGEIFFVLKLVEERGKLVVRRSTESRVPLEREFHGFLGTVTRHWDFSEVINSFLINEDVYLLSLPNER